MGSLLNLNKVSQDEQVGQQPVDPTELLNQYNALKSPKPFGPEDLIVTPQQAPQVQQSNIPNEAPAPEQTTSEQPAPDLSSFSNVATPKPPMNMQDDELNNAIAQRNKALNMIPLNTALNNVGTVFASGGKTLTSPYNNEALEEKLANAPVEGVKAKRAGEMEKIKIEGQKDELQTIKEKSDSGSAISKAYRDFAKQMGFNVPEDISASQLDKISPLFEKYFASKEAAEARRMMNTGKSQEKIDKDFEKMGQDLDTNRPRTGELGKNQARFNAAARVRALVEASGNNPSRISVRELASTVGNMLTMGSQTAIGQINELVPHTMSGDAAKIQEWLTGDPTGTDQQKFIQLYLKIANREAEVADNQIKTAQFKKAYGTYKHLKNSDPERFYDQLSTFTNMDSDDIKKMEAQKGFKGNYIENKPKTVVKKGYNPSTNQTQFIYDDGTKEIVEGKK